MRELRQLVFDWLLMCLVVSLILAAAIGVTRIYGADDSPEYWRAKAAAAIAINLPSVAPATISQEPRTKNQERPLVTFYCASWCVPCQQAKAELNDVKLPFDIKIIDVSNGGQPDWCDSLPAFAWDHKGQTRYVLGWPGVKKLIKQWEATNKEQPHARSSPANRWPAMTGYQPGWTWPGDLRQHLQSTHGVNEAGQLTQDQAEALHDALHQGYSLQQIRSRLK